MNCLRKIMSKNKCFYCELKIGKKYITASDTSLKFCDKQCEVFSLKRCPECNTVVCFANINNEIIEKCNNNYISVESDNYIVINSGVLNKIDYFCNKDCVKKNAIKIALKQI